MVSEGTHIFRVCLCSFFGGAPKKNLGWPVWRQKEKVITLSSGCQIRETKGEKVGPKQLVFKACNLHYLEPGFYCVLNRALADHVHVRTLVDDKSQ